MKAIAIDAALRRYLALVQPEVARQRARLDAALAEGELHYDHRRGLLEVRVDAQVLHRWDAELLAMGQPEHGILRWAWCDVPSGALQSRLDAVVREGRSLGLAGFTADGVLALDEPELELLVGAAALLGRADGVWARPLELGTQYFVLASSAPMRQRPSSAQHMLTRPLSSAPGPLATTPALPGFALPSQTRLAGSALGSMLPPPMPPTLEGLPPVLEPPVRTPSGPLLEPAIRCALQQLEAQSPGYQQAVFIVSVEIVAGKLRFHVGLVALDATIELAVLEPSTELRQHTVHLLREDMNERNGRWTRLVVHLSRAGDYVHRRVEVRAAGAA